MKWLRWGEESIMGLNWPAQIQEACSRCRHKSNRLAETELGWGLPVVNWRAASPRSGCGWLGCLPVIAVSCSGQIMLSRQQLKGRKVSEHLPQKHTKTWVHNFKDIILIYINTYTYVCMYVCKYLLGRRVNLSWLKTEKKDEKIGKMCQWPSNFLVRLARVLYRYFQKEILTKLFFDY